MYGVVAAVKLGADAPTVITSALASVLHPGPPMDDVAAAVNTAASILSNCPRLLMYDVAAAIELHTDALTMIMSASALASHLQVCSPTDNAAALQGIDNVVVAADTINRIGRHTAVPVCTLFWLWMMWQQWLMQLPVSGRLGASMT
jgi:hypothetical protein